MKTKATGIAWLKGGVYQKIFVEGVTFSLSDIDVKKLNVNGVLRGTKIKCEDEMTVAGIVRGNIHLIGGNRVGMISGVATIQKQENNYVILNVDGEIHADTIMMDTFNVKGRCRISRLEANIVKILENDQKKYNRRKSSIIDELICKKLKAYDLTAEKVVADEVELYGGCKIGTLIYKEKKYVSPDCIIENEKQLVS